jgi:hypothetical protein
MSGLQQKYFLFHEITVGATRTKLTTCKEQATEFFEEASALSTEFRQGYVQLDGISEHPLV